MRTRVLLSVVGAMVIIGSSSGLAQDVTITNVAQFTDLLDQTGLVYPLVNPWQPAMFYPTLGTFYCDFDQLTNAIGDVRYGTASIQDGISVWGVRLIRTASGTAVVYASGGQFSREHDDFVVQIFQDWSTQTVGLQGALNLNTRQTLAAQVRIWGAQDLLWNGP